MKYGIKLYNDQNKEITFMWETDNEEFNERFNKMLVEYLREKNGYIQINDEIFESNNYKK